MHIDRFYQTTKGWKIKMHLCPGKIESSRERAKLSVKAENKDTVRLRFILKR